MSNREIFIDKLRRLSKEEMLERYIALLNTEKLTDYVADLEAKLAESESKVAVGRFWHSAYEGKQLDYDKLNDDYNKQEKLLSKVLADKSKLQFEYDQLKQQLAMQEHTITTLIEDNRASQECYKMQLAQKDKQLEKLKSENHALISDNAYQEADMFEFNSRIEQLQKQLAEKDEIIDWQNEIVEGVKQEEELLAQKLKSLGVDCIEDLGKTYHQDKISFTLEQLEKVKEFLINSVAWWGYKTDSVSPTEFIDDQIKQLKEMPNEK